MMTEKKPFGSKAWLSVVKVSCRRRERDEPLRRLVPARACPAELDVAAEHGDTAVRELRDVLAFYEAMRAIDTSSR
jgi:hypothetical protein